MPNREVPLFSRFPQEDGLKGGDVAENGKSGTPAASAPATESRPTPQAAEVISLKGDALLFSALLPLREMHRAGGPKALQKAGAGQRQLLACAIIKQEVEPCRD